MKKALIFTFREIKEEKTSEEVLNEKQGKKTFVFDVNYRERGSNDGERGSKLRHMEHNLAAAKILEWWLASQANKQG